MKLPHHLNFTLRPTPIQKLHKISEMYAPYQIFIKRDDLTGMELSGNKVRKLDFLMAQAIAQGAKRVITCGGIQSNHCRATAFYAQKLGLKTTLVLKGQVPDHLTGNYLLNTLLEVDVKIISNEEYRRVDAIMQTLADGYDETCYIIPEGGSNHVGAWGYARAFQEITEQMPDVETIVVATGSGGTHAGLLLGKKLTNRPVSILSVNVCDDAPFFQDKIQHILQTVKKEYGVNFDLKKDEIAVIDGFVGQGYGLVEEKELTAIKRVAQLEGIVLDPVYGVKAWLGFEQLLREKKIPGEKVLFIHTGGIFGLFPFGDRFLSLK